jgi:hypothetical protein
MNKQINVLKLTVLTASVAALAVGCASSGYARYDQDNANHHDMTASAGADVGPASVGASAGADIGTAESTHKDSYREHHHYKDKDAVAVSEESEGEARETVSALSFTPVTNPRRVNIFPFYDWNMASIDTYTFAVPDPNLTVTTRSDLPSFSESLPPGSVYVESAGGAGEVRAGRVIQHSPNPGMGF